MSEGILAATGRRGAPIPSPARSTSPPDMPLRGQMSLAVGADPGPENGGSHDDHTDGFQRPDGSSRGAPVTSKEVQPAARTEMFDKQNLARYFRVSVDTIERLVKAGELPAVRIGNQVRFTLEDVDGFIERHRTKERTA